MEKSIEQGKGIALNRRSFLLGGTAALGAAALGLAGCAPKSRDEAAASGENTETVSSWSTPPESIVESDISDTIDCEVLVVGGGNAGQFAAAAAAEAGADVLLIEKLDKIGTTARQWIGAIDSRYQKEQGVEVNKNELVETLCFYASHRCNQRLVKLWADNSGRVMDWLGDTVAEYDPTAKIHFESDTGNSDHGIYKSYAIQHNVQNDEAALKSLDFVGQKLGDLNVRINTKFPMVQLERNEDGAGRVTGVIAEDRSSGSYVRINASKGVILCTGGYAGNSEMMEELNPMAARACVAFEAAGEMNVGDGIKAGAWIGAQKQEQNAVQVFDRGGVTPDAEAGCLYTSPGIITHIGSQPFLKVNKKGERFCNESVPYDFIYAAATYEPSLLWCEVWDANWREQTRQFHTLACSRIQYSPTGGKLVIFDEDATSAFHENTLIPAGIVVEAQTIDELAEKLGIPADSFTKTVERYNELCAKGTDEDFGKESYRMMPLNTPPYRAATLGGQLMCTMDGLLINTDLQVLDKDFSPIEGLYAAGNDSGGFFSNNYPELIIGTTSSRAITFGYLAGKSAAGA